MQRSRSSCNPRDIQHLTSHMKSDAVYAHLLAKSKLMELFSYFIMNIDVDEITFKNLSSIEKLTKILTYIDTHIERNITIHELAEIAYMHPNYFIRLFKQQIGVPPIQYITRKKITKAKELLRGRKVLSVRLPMILVLVIFIISPNSSRKMWV